MHPILYISQAIAKCLPIMIILLLIILYVIFKKKDILVLLILSLICDIFNRILKEGIFRNIYKYYNTDYLPILGKGNRPDNAKSCSCLNIINENKLFGMPSGHTQIITFISTYIILNMIYKLNFKIKNIIIFILILIILILIVIYVMFTRVYITYCHTIRQVLIGGLIGLLFGIVSFYIVHFGKFKIINL